MTSAFESQGTGSLFPGLTSGLRTLSDNQVVPFTQYVRYVLPLDGYIFWLRTASAQVAGSLHIVADKRQGEDETIAVNRVVFTTGEEVQIFNAIEPDRIWVGEWEGLKFAFSRSGPKYRAADIYHYVGDAVYPAMESQLIDVGAQLPATTLVVSNSLPIWLTLPSYTPVWLNAPNPAISLFPSFAVPDNIVPPYGVIHIEPSRTVWQQAIPALAPLNTSEAQLAQDNVSVTLYGLTNDLAWNWINVVLQFSRDTDAIGIVDAGILRDEKRTQPELGILAMKKTIDYTVSYNQGTNRTLARALIEHASATIYPPH